MKLQIYYKKNGLADVEINEEIVASNIKHPELFVRRYLELNLL
jgi:hypothetical protein